MIRQQAGAGAVNGKGEPATDKSESRGGEQWEARHVGRTDSVVLTERRSISLSLTNSTGEAG